MRTSRHPSRSTSRIASLTFGMNLGSVNARQDQVVSLNSDAFIGLGSLALRFIAGGMFLWLYRRKRNFSNRPLPSHPPPSFPRRACPREDGGGNPSLITAPPPVVLADAGTHPHPSFPRRACPREDGGGNPSANPIPHSCSPSRCPRGCGDPSPSVIPAQSLPS